MKIRANIAALSIAILCLAVSNPAQAAHKDKFKKSSWKPQFYFVAQNTHKCDMFYGIVQDNPLIGRATVEFAFPDGCSNCQGYAQVTHFPHGGPTKGQRGFIKATCADGRSIKGKFTTTSLTTGDGTATDTLGNEYKFTFGHTAEESIQTVNEIRKKLDCPECTAADIEMKVQAQIINPLAKKH